ncbi:MAG TPA: DoxX family protein [Candidatus Acidoferrum sp.]|jgi:hypothetical protein|nr:DoxX family protein [Candidatus Acidoferrum sp.]
MTKMMHEEIQQGSNRRAIWGNAMIRFCGFGLLFSSAVKFLHPAKALAYMASMGYEGGTYYFIAVLEMMIAIFFLLPSTRSVGLLLLSGYLGGAISAHLAIHRFNTGGPFLFYMANHPYVGALMPGVLLVLAWMGIWMRHPGVLGSLREESYENELPPQGQRETAMASRF